MSRRSERSRLMNKLYCFGPGGKTRKRRHKNKKTKKHRRKKYKKRKGGGGDIIGAALGKAAMAGLDFWTWTHRNNRHYKPQGHHQAPLYSSNATPTNKEPGVEYVLSPEPVEKPRANNADPGIEPVVLSEKSDGGKKKKKHRKNKKTKKHRKKNKTKRRRKYKKKSKKRR